jgi:hypothetical protein
VRSKNFFDKKVSSNSYMGYSNIMFKIKILNANFRNPSYVTGGRGIPVSDLKIILLS